jgi:hypothetical protein
VKVNPLRSGGLLAASPSPRHGNRQPDHAAAFRVEVVVVDSPLQKTPDELGAAIQRGACA